MRFGLFSMNTGPCTYPGPMSRIALASEAAGFDSLWTPEHYVLPSTRAVAFPVDPTERMLDPLETLSYLAGKTDSILLGTGVVVLPHHNPVVLAKRIATLQTLSEHRFLLGVGVGHLEAEFEALGTVMDGRGRRADEILDGMASLWFDDEPVIDGEHVRFSGVKAYPRPEQVPIIVGGRTAAAYRRAVRRAHGFYGWLLDPVGTKTALDELHQAATSVNRPEALGRLEISVTPPEPVDSRLVQEYMEHGVDRLIIAPERGSSEADVLALIERIHREFISQAG